MRKKFSLLLALLFSCTSVCAATEVSTWADLGIAGDISVTSDITAGTLSKIDITGNKTIEGNSYSLTGASGSYFDVKGGGDFTFQNFGKLSNGTEASNTFSYTDKSDNVIYKTIDNSVNSFTSSVFKLDNAPSASKITIDNSVFYNNTGAGVLNNSPSSTSIEQNFSFDILNSYFVNNSSTGSGGAVRVDGGIANIENSVFVNNSSRNGGAIIALSSSNRVPTLSVKNSIFDSNKASSSLGGGAIAVTNPSILKVENSVFTNNTAEDGGAIKGQNPSHIEYIKNSIFKNNTATDGDGGAIVSSKLTTIEGSVFENNKSAWGGGAIWLATADLTQSEKADFYIKESEFIGNISDDGYGGAVSLYSGTNNHTFHITDTEFRENTSANSIAGALFTSSNVEYKNVKFIENEAKDAGGAIYTDGYDSTATFDNVTFSGNKAGTLGGAIHSYLSTDTYKNSTFKENESGADGGAISIKESPSTFDNVTFTGNKSGATGGAIYSESSSDTYINSTFDNNTASAGGATFIVFSPQNTFVDTSFTNNKSDADAGAILAVQSGVNIFAHNKDVLFSGNEATGNTADYNAGNDIYFETDDQTFNLNLNASEGKKVVFDGGLASWVDPDGSAIININQDGQSYKNINKETIPVGNTGEIQFNNRIGDAGNGFDINLYSGQLSIGQNPTINAAVDNPDGFLNNKNNLNIKGNAVLNTVNGYIGEISPTAFTVADNTNWEYKFDVDLKAKEADKIIGAQNGTGSSVDISNLMLHNAPTENNLKIVYSDKNINGVIDEDHLVVIGNTTYSIKTGNDDTDGSYIIVKKSAPKGGLAWAVHTKASQYLVDPEAINNGIVDLWFENNDDPNVIDNTVLKDLSIDGNNQDIISNTNIDGLIIKEGIKLTLNDVNEFKGFNNSFVNNGTLILNNTSVLNNAGSSAITNNNGVITITADKRDVLIDAGKAGNAISANGGEINLNGSKLINIKGNVSGSNDAALNINTNVDFNGDIISINTIQNNVKVNINNNIEGGSYTLNNGQFNLNGSLNNADFTINGGNLNIYNNFNADNFVLNSGLVNLVNNELNNIAANSMNIKNTTDFIVDVDLQNKLMDTLRANSADYSDGTINVKAFNYLSDTTQSNLKINFASDAIKDYVTTDVNSYMNKIYKYNVFYDKNDGTFNFATPAGTNNYNSFNPAVIASPVAAQLGGYLIQLNSYDEAFRNMDMYMLLTRKQRQAMKLRNKYASTAYNNIVFEKDLSRQQSSAGWFRPFTTFENVPLRNGPRVSNVSYGSFFGSESEMYDLGHGWDGLWGVYAGYNGSHQAYNGVGIYQNGGMLGAVGMAYKGNFFTGLTVNAGANVGEASTMYGNDNFTMLLAGIASKSGYNFELADGKFIIQPNLLMSYSFVNTFDYTNAAGVSINSDPLHAIQLEPGLKFIGNLKNGWQPYAMVNMVWNIMDRTHFKANDVSLPELSVKPFIKYGVGVRKSWGERFTGYFQCYIMNGGRNGIGLQTGFKWAIGKTSNNTKKQSSEIKKTEIKSLSKR